MIGSATDEALSNGYRPPGGFRRAVPERAASFGTRDNEGTLTPNRRSRYHTSLRHLEPLSPSSPARSVSYLHRGASSTRSLGGPRLCRRRPLRLGSKRKADRNHHGLQSRPDFDRRSGTSVLRFPSSPNLERTGVNPAAVQNPQPVRTTRVTGRVAGAGSPQTP